eukprot:3762691-Rhodomonas_salina.1
MCVHTRVPPDSEPGQGVKQATFFLQLARYLPSYLGVASHRPHACGPNPPLFVLPPAEESSRVEECPIGCQVHARRGPESTECQTFSSLGSKMRTENRRGLLARHAAVLQPVRISILTSVLLDPGRCYQC